MGQVFARRDSTQDPGFMVQILCLCALFLEIFDNIAPRFSFSITLNFAHFQCYKDSYLLSQDYWKRQHNPSSL